MKDAQIDRLDMTKTQRKKKHRTKKLEKRKGTVMVPIWVTETGEKWKDIDGEIKGYLSTLPRKET